MQLPLFQVDAFTSQVFRGNPAAVCPLPGWLPDRLLQAIAAENNLSETAFLVGGPARWELRWFTPTVEVDLCGHATLASAHVVLRHLQPDQQSVTFDTHSGPLEVVKDGDRLTMDFPSLPGMSAQVTEPLVAILGTRPRELHVARDWMAVFEREDEVRGLAPDLARLERLEAFALIVTAPGRNCDFVSRFFAPRAGIPEDPVTGSAHCTLTPYWAARLGRSKLRAQQVSRRGGEIHCELRDDRVRISGRTTLYLEGHIQVPDPEDLAPEEP